MEERQFKVFQKLVKDPAQELASLQDYLVDHTKTRAQARTIFKIKTRMANCLEIFKAGGLTRPCPLCLEAPDTQQLSLVCKIMENISVNTRYENKFHSKVSEETAKLWKVSPYQKP